MCRHAVGGRSSRSTGPRDRRTIRLPRPHGRRWGRDCPPVEGGTASYAPRPRGRVIHGREQGTGRGAETGRRRTEARGQFPTGGPAVPTVRDGVRLVGGAA